MRRLSVSLALALCSLPSSAAAQGLRQGQGWSTFAGQTTGEGSTVVVGELGWPGLTVAALRGASPKLDVGGALSLNYGFEGVVTRANPGLKLQGVMRLELLQTEKLNLGLKFAPGPFLYFDAFGTYVGLTIPFSFSLGIPVGSALMLNVTVDANLWALFGSYGGLYFQTLAGGGAQYYLDKNVAVGFNFRVGPSVPSLGSGLPRLNNRADIALQALVSAAYKL